MINFPFEVGILGWVSTAIFWIVGIVIVWKLIEGIWRWW